MSQPVQITSKPSDTTRLGRMLQGGRLTATLRSKKTGDHITLTLHSMAKLEGKWTHVPFEQSSHVFIKGGDGKWGSNKVGTYYPQKGLIYFDTQDPAWQFTAKHVLIAAETGILDTANYDIQETERCGVCGLALTDPVSIERGIGPKCYGDLTGSHHYHKAEVASSDPADHHQRQVAKRVLETNDVMNAVLGGPTRAEAQKILDKKGRALPKTFAELAQSVR